MQLHLVKGTIGKNIVNFGIKRFEVINADMVTKVNVQESQALKNEKEQKL